MIRLQAGELACEIEPGLGGCIAGLWLRDLPLLRFKPAAQLDAAGASRAGPGLAILQPGDSCGAQLAIEVERMP